MEKISVIFLDIDGVLNIFSPSYSTNYYRPDGSVQWMDEHLVIRLNYLIDRTGASIVISSSWRSDMDDLKKQLLVSGFKHWDAVVGKTPIFMNGRRGDEIQSYLDHHPEIKTFVVLDDVINNICGDKCSTISKMDVIEVDAKNGLTHQDVNLAYHKIIAGK